MIKIDILAISYYNEQGLLDRAGGPAREYHSIPYKAWYKNGLLHREDGPALIDGDTCHWYIDGFRIVHR